MSLTSIRHRLASAGSERGFTIIEIMVAVIILTIGAGAMGAVYMRVSDSQLDAKVRNRKVSAAETIFSQLRADPSWMSSGSACTKLQPGGKCDLSYEFASDPILTDADINLQLQATVTAEMVDSPLDGVGAEDTDSKPYDAFRVLVSIVDKDAQDPTEIAYSTSGTITASSRSLVGS